MDGWPNSAWYKAIRMETQNEKTAIVTGATTGIGFATALRLAEMGFAVAILARNESRGHLARQEISKRTDNERVSVFLADLARLGEVRNVADEILDMCPRIDVLINNAAVIPARREVTPDGLEVQFAVNHLAPFLLTNLLLERLCSSAPTRIVNVSSGVHSSGRVDLEDLQSLRGYSANNVYANTKLMNVLFTNELTRRLAGKGVTANSLHPGVINTQLYQAYMGRNLVPDDLEDWKRGAETTLFAATSPELEGVSGAYLSGRRMAKASAKALDENLARELWAASARLCDLPAD